MPKARFIFHLLIQIAQENTYCSQKSFAYKHIVVTKKEKIKDLQVIDGNRIEFIAMEEDFTVEVTGFDTSKKDIYVKTRKLKDNLTIKEIKNG